MADATLDDIVSLRQKITKLFEASIKTIAPDEPNMVPLILSWSKNEAGDYQWYFWSRLKDNSTEFEDPEYVRQAIQNNFPITDMIESFDVPSPRVERQYSFRENFEGQSIWRVTPSFINVILSKQWMAKRIQNMLIDGIETWAPKLPVKRAIVDFSSPNMAEIHVDQLRSTIIGDMLARLLEFSKVEVLRRNDVRDLGSQCGMLIEYLFERVPYREINDQDFRRFEVFLMASKQTYDDFRKRAQQALSSLQGGDERYLKAWTRICEIRRKCFEPIYERLDVHLEEKGESFYNPYIGQTLDMLNEKGLIVEHEGAKVTKHIPGRKPLTVVDSDGGFDYVLTALAVLWYRINVENAEWIIYVTERGQQEHFDMIFTIARLAGWLPTSRSKYPKTSHVGFDPVTCEVGMRAVKLVDLLDEAEIQCKAAHRKRGWIGEDLEHTAEAVAYAAVKYAHLNSRPAKINFDQMLDVEGDTVVYLLYAHTRANSALQTSGKDIEELKKKGELKMENDLERELGLHLLRFSELIEDAFASLIPNVLCEYLYDLAKKFHYFYDEYQVVGSAEETSRLLLCEATRVVMSKCFYLLGITRV